jgi:hypothetical protein
MDGRTPPAMIANKENENASQLTVQKQGHFKRLREFNSQSSAA